MLKCYREKEIAARDHANLDIHDWGLNLSGLNIRASKCYKNKKTCRYYTDFRIL